MRGILFGVNRLPHHYQLLGAVLLCGSITAAAYGLEQAGIGAIAASFLSFWAIFVGTRLITKIATRKTKYFADTSKIVRTVHNDFQDWLNNRRVLALAILGIPVAIGFVALRAGIELALASFGNVWIALSFGLLFSAVICSPLLFRGLAEVVNSDSSADPVETEDAEPVNSEGKE